MAKLSKAVISAASATSHLNYREYVQFHTLVRKEFVSRNREKYTRECFKIGDVVKFWRTKKLATGVSHWHSRTNRHDLAGDVLFGVISEASVTRSGRIMRYHIQFIEGGSLDAPSSIARGVRQVAAATADETRITKLLHNVRK